jgi:CheY-like chemotaxis protein
MIVWGDIKTWCVLVVDDEVDNVEVAAETLEFLGAVVKTAVNGLEAIHTLESFAANLILLDLSMPTMSGWEARMKIKANERTKDIPILALSAHAMVGDKERALAVGFDGYLTKPINLLTFAEDIRAALVKTLSRQS